jgi:hypothetical protein
MELVFYRYMYIIFVKDDGYFFPGLNFSPGLIFFGDKTSDSCRITNSDLKTGTCSVCSGLQSDGVVDSIDLSYYHPGISNVNVDGLIEGKSTQMCQTSLNMHFNQISLEWRKNINSMVIVLTTFQNHKSKMNSERKKKFYDNVVLESILLTSVIPRSNRTITWLHITPLSLFSPPYPFLCSV